MYKKSKIWKAYAATLGVVAFTNYLWQRFVLKRRIIRIQLAGLDKPVCIRNQPSDHALFTQLFIEEEYGQPLSREGTRIIDCGANIGLAALYFARQYPAAVITCIEPDPDNYSMLKRNTRHFKNIHCLQKAVWNKAEPLTIYGYSRGPAGLMIQSSDDRDHHKVDAMLLSDIIGEADCIDILKIDIEGSEQQVLLSGDTSWIEHVQTMFVELHEDIHPGITQAVTEKFAAAFAVSKKGEYHIFERIPLQ